VRRQEVDRSGVRRSASARAANRASYGGRAELAGIPWGEGLCGLGVLGGSCQGVVPPIDRVSAAFATLKAYSLSSSFSVAIATSSCAWITSRLLVTPAENRVCASP